MKPIPVKLMEAGLSLAAWGFELGAGTCRHLQAVLGGAFPEPRPSSWQHATTDTNVIGIQPKTSANGPATINPKLGDIGIPQDLWPRLYAAGLNESMVLKPSKGYIMMIERGCARPSTVLRRLEDAYKAAGYSLYD